MPAPRFFVDLESEFFSLPALDLPKGVAHHAGRVLRMVEGDPIVLFNGKGASWQAQLHFENGVAQATSIKECTHQTESPIEMTLIQSMVSSEKLDWIAEKATELGVSRLIIVPAERSVTRLQGERLQKRLDKLVDIVRAACEQCGRNVVPSVKASSLEQALQETQAQMKLFMAPGASNKALLSKTTKSVAFAIGPEGGFSEAEILKAQDKGWSPTLLGPRVLRTETAGLTALAWAGALIGDL